MLEPQLGTSIEEVGALPIWSKIPKIPIWGKMENAFFFRSAPLKKIPGKTATAQKVVPFSRWERPDWFSVFQFRVAIFCQSQAVRNQIITAISQTSS